MDTVLGTLAVKLAADTKELMTGISASKNALEDMSGSFRAIGAIATAAFAAMSTAIFVAVRAAEESAEAQNKLAATAAASGKAFNVPGLIEYAAQLQRVTTFEDDATVGLMAQMVAMGRSESSIRKLTPAIMDLASFMGIDLHSATMMVNRAMTGQTGALSRNGIALTDAQEKVMKLGTETQKASLLSEEFGKRFGGAAQRASNNTTGMMQQIKNAVGDMGETFGGTMKGPVEEGLGKVRDLVIQLSESFAGMDTETKGLIGTAALFTTGLVGTVAALAGIALVLPQVVAGFKLMGSTMLLLGKAMLPLLGIVIVLGLFVVALGLVRRAWDGSMGKLGDVATAVMGEVRLSVMHGINYVIELFNDFTDSVAEAWAYVKVLTSGGTADWAEVYQNTAEQLKIQPIDTVETEKALNNLAEDMENVSVNWGDELKKTIGAAGQTFKDVFSKALAAAGVDAEKLFSGSTNAVSPFVGSPKDLAGPGNTNPLTVPTAVEPVYANTMRKDKQAWDTGKSLAEEASQGMLSTVANVASSFGEGGQVIGNAVTAFAQGGPVAAFAQLGMDILSKTEGFKKISGAITRIMGTLVKALSPLMDVVFQLLEPVLGLAEGFMVFLKGPLKILSTIMKALEPVFMVVGCVVWGVLSAITAVWNAILGAIASVFHAIGGISIFGKHPFAFLDRWGDALDRAQVHLGSFDSMVTEATSSIQEGTQAQRQQTAADLEAYAIQAAQVAAVTAIIATSLIPVGGDLAAGTMITAMAAAATAVAARQEADAAAATAAEGTGDALDNASAAGEGLADTLGEINDSLSNVPEGIKMASYRFNAAEGDMGAASQQLAFEGATGVGGRTLTIENVNMYGVSDTDSLLNDLEQEAAWSTYQKNGSTESSSGSATRGAGSSGKGTTGGRSTGSGGKRG